MFWIGIFIGLSLGTIIGMAVEHMCRNAALEPSDEWEREHEWHTRVDEHTEKYDLEPFFGCLDCDDPKCPSNRPIES